MRFQLTSRGQTGAISNKYPSAVGGLRAWEGAGPLLVDESMALQAARDLFANGPWILRNLQIGRLKICPFEELISYVPVGASVLDVGCGRALFLSLLAALRRNIHGVGVDISEGAVRAAEMTVELVREKHGSSAIQIYCANHESLPERSFQIVSMIDVIHHVPVQEQQQFFAAVVRHLAPGGLLLYKDMVSMPFWRVLANRLHDLLVSHEAIHEVPLSTVLLWAKSQALQCIQFGFVNRYWYGHEIAIFRKC